MRYRDLVAAIIRSGSIAVCCAGLLCGLAQAADTYEKACADCHGKDGASTEPDVPILGGQSAVYLSDALDDYRKDKRPCPESKYRAGDKSRPGVTMCKIAKDLNAKDEADVTKALSNKPFVRARQQVDAAKAAAGKKIHELRCEKCHADGGSSKADDSGILAGQQGKYLEGAFKEIVESTRPVPKKMKPKFEELGPEDRDALLQYYRSFQ